MRALYFILEDVLIGILYKTQTLCATDDIRREIWAFQFNFVSIKSPNT